MFSKFKNKTKRTKASSDEVMLKRWEELQRRGKKKYVWIDGVVKFGIGLPTFGVLIDLLIGDNVYSSTRELIVDYSGSLIAFSVAFYFYRVHSWNFYENWSREKRFMEDFDSKVDFCYYCGSELGDHDICPECGKKIE